MGTPLRSPLNQPFPLWHQVSEPVTMMTILTGLSALSPASFPTRLHASPVKHQSYPVMFMLMLINCQRSLALLPTLVVNWEAQAHGFSISFPMEVRPPLDLPCCFLPAHTP